MQEYGYFFNKYSRIRNKGDLYVSVTIRILMQISLSSYFLTDVEKLYHICQKALSHIWKSFTTSVKNIKSNYQTIIPLYFHPKTKFILS